jgi:hypothetical protein
MTRNESDREDLMREAVALVRRAEFTFPGRSDPVFAGFKRTGGLSIYFGPDPVYQFDENGRLRRAYFDGLLYRTQGETLARMKRERSERETVLVRTDLSPAELQSFLNTMQEHLRWLKSEIDSSSYSHSEQIPTDVDLEPELIAAIEQALSAAPPLAPAIPGRR